MKAVMVGRVSGGNLFYVIDGDTDGAIVTPSRDVKPVSFLSFVTRKKVSRITNSKFHKFLWDGVDKPNDRWENIVVYKVQQVPEHMLAGVDVLPNLEAKKKDARYDAINEKIEIIDTFKVAIETGFHEKALGPRIRPARFDPNAEDGDGDGIVQDGTTFARPATPGTKPARRARRVQRAANAMSRDSGMAARRSYLPRVGVIERFKSRDKKFYRDRYAKQSKRVDDAFNGGKPLKTYGDIASAFARAHPGFAAGTSMADYVEIGLLKEDEPISMAHKEHAYAFLLGVLMNPSIKDIDVEILSRESRRRLGKDPIEGADGAVAYGARGKIGRDRNKVNGYRWRTVAKDRKPRLEMMYADQTSYDQIEDVRVLGNFQLETHKMFITMLEDTPTAFSDTSALLQALQQILEGTGTQENLSPEDTDAIRKAWEEARAMAARSVNLHEMTHLSNYAQAYKEAIKDRGIESLSVDEAIQQGVLEPIADMGDDAIRQAAIRSDLRELSVTAPEAMFRFAAEYQRLIQSTNPRDKILLQRLVTETLKDPDGNDLKKGESIARWLQAVGWPKPNGTQHDADDPLHVDDLLPFFFTPGAGGRPVWSDKDDPYYKRSAWGRNTAASKLDLANGGSMGMIKFEEVWELGLPETRGLPAISVEDTQTLTKAVAQVATLFRLDPDISQWDFDDSIPVVGGAIWEDSPGIMRAIMSSNAQEWLANALTQISMDTSMSDAQKERLRAYIVEQAIIAPKLMDDLSPREKAIAVRIAKLTGGGEYASYMGTFTHIDSFQGLFFNQRYMELLAELGAAALFGSEIKVPDGSGMRTLNDVEKKVMSKLLKWLWPEGELTL